MGKSWSLINSLIGKTSKDNNITELCVDDSSTSDDCVIAETFNEFFISIGSKLASESCSDSMHATKTNNTPRSSTIFKFSEIGVEEVTAGLRNLKISKATGIDMIPSRALKIAADIIAPSITWIFNLSLKTGIFVDEWKKACVLSIYKSGDRRFCVNYRPISILPVISKILERSVFDQLYKFLNDNSLLSKYQSCFRPKNSTLTALLQMCDEWHQNLDCGKLIGVVFLDIRLCENYRPISILSVISKILERSVFDQLYKFLNDNSLLSKYQSGFRPKNSTLTALLHMCDEWHQNLDCGKMIGVVFLDIRKAFDSIDHKILLHKMKTQFGLTGIELG